MTSTARGDQEPVEGRSETSDEAPVHALEHAAPFVLWTDSNVTLSDESVLVSTFQTVPHVDIGTGRVAPRAVGRTALAQYVLTPGRFFSMAELFARMSAQWAGRFAENADDLAAQLKAGIDAGLATGREQRTEGETGEQT